jgi:hypothetical protein
MVVLGLVVLLIVAAGGLVMYARQASVLSGRITQLEKQSKSKEMQAPGSVAPLHLQLSRVKPGQATTTIGWPQPPQLLDIYIDATEAKYSVFQVTIDKIDGGRLLQLHRVARDSNRDLRFKLNSSAFGPGEYLLQFDGYNWRGEVQELGWVRLDMR